MSAEKDHWQALCARPQDEFRVGIWGEPEWEGRIGPCLDQIIPEIEPAFSLSGRVLDLGCGPGRLLVPMADRFPKVGFVDIAQGMLDRVESRPNISTLLCDGGSLPETGPLCAAYSMIVFQHVELSLVCHYIRRIGEQLVPGGLFRFQFIEGQRADFLNHHHPFAEILNALEEAGMILRKASRGQLYPEWTWVTASKK